MDIPSGKRQEPWNITMFYRSINYYKGAMFNRYVRLSEGRWLQFLFCIWCLTFHVVTQKFAHGSSKFGRFWKHVPRCLFLVPQFFQFFSNTFPGLLSQVSPKKSREVFSSDFGTSLCYGGWDVYTLHSTLYSLPSTPHAAHSTLHTPKSPLCTLQQSAPFHNPQSTLVRSLQ